MSSTHKTWAGELCKQRFFNGICVVDTAWRCVHVATEGEWGESMSSPHAMKHCSLFGFENLASSRDWIPGSISGKEKGFPGIPRWGQPVCWCCSCVRRQISRGRWREATVNVIANVPHCSNCALISSTCCVLWGFKTHHADRLSRVPRDDKCALFAEEFYLERIISRNPRWLMTDYGRRSS